VAASAVAAVAMALAGIFMAEPALGTAAESDAVPGVEAEVPATAMNRSVRAANNSPKLVSDPEDPDFVALAHRLDAPGFSCALQLSGDGGWGWVPADPVPQLPEGAERCYAPEVAFGPDGVLYYLFVGLAGRGNQPMGVFLATSDDRGRSFSAPRQILGPLNFGVRMALDREVGSRGRMHLAWLKATSPPGLGSFGPPPNPIMTAHSDDGGQRFSEPVQVSDGERDQVVAPALTLGPDHAVHVAYYDLQDDEVDYRGLEGPVWPDNWSIVLASSADGGESFAGGEVVTDEIVPHERVMVIFTMAPPALVADGDNGVCLAWTDARHGNADVLASCNEAGAGSWPKPVRVNDGPIANDRTQELPQLSVAPNGRLDAVFYDRRASPDDLYNHVSFTSSADGGRTFAPNVQATTLPSFTQIGPQYAIPSAEGRFDFGGRLGLLSTDSTTLTAWADTRNSRPLTTAQDIFTTRIGGLPGDQASTSSWLRVGIVVLVAGALVALAVALLRRRRPEASEVAAKHDEPTT
jgi:hypothetical protein